MGQPTTEECLERAVWLEGLAAAELHEAWRADALRQLAAYWRAIAKISAAEDAQS
jgi:hypothetical protein